MGQKDEQHREAAGEPLARVPVAGVGKVRGPEQRGSASTRCGRTISVCGWLS